MMGLNDDDHPSFDFCIYILLYKLTCVTAAAARAKRERSFMTLGCGYVVVVVCVKVYRVRSTSG